jgi:plasmid replication initiation protein
LAYSYRTEPEDAVAIWQRNPRDEIKATIYPRSLCGLPVRKPPRNEMLYERRNGNFVLQITGHPNYGLPFGQDRIVSIYLATLAVRQKSQTIRFRTAAEMLETFGMHKGGKEYRRLVAAFERIFGATIFFGTDSLSEGGATVTVQLLPGGSDLVQPGSAAVPHFRSV